MYLKDFLKSKSPIKNAVKKIQFRISIYGSSLSRLLCKMVSEDPSALNAI